MPSVLISPTAYKGTLSPLSAARAMARAFPRGSATLIPLADGGDGTLETLSSVLHGRRVRTRVTGPLGRPVLAEWAIIRRVPGLRGMTAVIEMARASGLALLRAPNRIMDATTRGTGELIREAIRLGCRNILVGVGGTATSDGGAGALAALGFRYRDAAGKELAPRPEDLMRLASIDRADARERLRSRRIIVLCDVTNPLLGPRGSARTFGPQKGATPAQVWALERFLRHWSRFANPGAKNRAGAGAAGATAFGLSAFAKARLVPGCAFIMKAARWRQAARKARLILTGEGRLDATSFSGKVPGEVARHRGKARVIAVCGSATIDEARARRLGIAHIELLGPRGKQAPASEITAAARRAAKIFSGRNSQWRRKR